MKIFLRIVWFVMLTVVTQVGGLVYVIHLVLYHKVWKPKKWKWLKRQASFVLLYAFVWLIVIPPLAKLNNRRPLPYINITTLQPQNWFTVFCNRHYVHEDLYYTMEAVSEDFSNQSADRMGGLTLNYLDANFPFMDGFPLIPHLSHNDGKKLDLAFRYNSNDDRLLRIKRDHYSAMACMKNLKKERLTKPPFVSERGGNMILLSISAFLFTAP